VADILPSRNGNARYAQSYAYTDTRPAKGVNYYRLRQVDTDGRVGHSERRIVFANQRRRNAADRKILKICLFGDLVVCRRPTNNQIPK
jgi:hypothetical protein